MDARRASLPLKVLYAMVAAMLLWAIIGSAMAAELVGQAVVVDGDTLEMHGTRIRLWGIDAPESDQLCRGEDRVPYRCGATRKKKGRGGKGQLSTFRGYCVVARSAA